MFLQLLTQSKKAMELDHFFLNIHFVLITVHSERVHKGKWSAHQQALE